MNASKFETSDPQEYLRTTLTPGESLVIDPAQRLGDRREVGLSAGACRLARIELESGQAAELVKFKYENSDGIHEKFYLAPLVTREVDGAPMTQVDQARMIPIPQTGLRFGRQRNALRDDNTPVQLDVDVSDLFVDGTEFLTGVSREQMEITIIDGVPRVDNIALRRSDPRVGSFEVVRPKTEEPMSSPSPSPSRMLPPPKPLPAPVLKAQQAVAIGDAQQAVQAAFRIVEAAKDGTSGDVVEKMSPKQKAMAIAEKALAELDSDARTRVWGYVVDFRWSRNTSFPTHTAADQAFAKASDRKSRLVSDEERRVAALFEDAEYTQ